MSWNYFLYNYAQSGGCYYDFLAFFFSTNKLTTELCRGVDLLEVGRRLGTFLNLNFVIQEKLIVSWNSRKNT